ncbi:MAG: HEPN domain-containing protein [Candidatus Woesearchaeota archaeon]
MNKIQWCLDISKGIELITPNERLARAYVKKAEDALRASVSLKDNRDWEITASYYTMYFSLYSLMMRMGVKCENHSCSIEFMNCFLKEYFSEADVDLLKKSAKSRVDVQYYSDRNISEKRYERISKNRARFLSKCKKVNAYIDEKTIRSIRSELREYKKKLNSS